MPSNIRGTNTERSCVEGNSVAAAPSRSAHAAVDRPAGFNVSLNSRTAGFDEIEEEFLARDVEVVRVLLAAGADPNARDATGATPLDRMRSAFEELEVGSRPPLYWLLNDVTAR
ncbi:MAG: hypothetical protein OXI50_03505 [Gammaproteobacteria bacterium]|nr:hypothetical protein [Gammaproteobacteria bacterium]